jgi:hypothetical protein
MILRVGAAVRRCRDDHKSTGNDGLILRGHFKMVNDKDLDRASCRFELQPNLLKAVNIEGPASDCDVDLSVPLLAASVPVSGVRLRAMSYLP